MNEAELPRDCAEDELSSTPAKPLWSKPALTVLEVERGTLATVGSASDGSLASVS